MANLKFTNYAFSTLAVSLGASDTAIVVQAGEGARFPAISGGDTFLATLVSASGNHEIVLCTARSGDNLTVARAQEGTVAASWPAGTPIELRATAGVLSAFLQLAGGVMSGDLDLGLAAQLLNARTYPHLSVGTVADGASGDVYCRRIRARGGNSAKAIWIPDASGADPVIGSTLATGSPIITRAMLKQLVFMYTGSAASLVGTPFVLCNGTGGTPDLRDRFIVGAGPGFPEASPSAYDWTGGVAGAKKWAAETAGTHDHGGQTQPHTLTVDQIPGHTHLARGGTAAGTGQVKTDAGNTGIADSTATASTGGGQSHRHDISSGGSHTHDIKAPPWYALCLVMFNPALP